MADYIGKIEIPIPSSSGLTFPLLPDYPFGMSRSSGVVEHRFGGNATLSVQRFSTTLGPRRHHFSKSALSFTERQDLYDQLGLEGARRVVPQIFVIVDGEPPEHIGGYHDMVVSGIESLAP